MRRALTIGHCDSCGASGVLADVKVFTRHGVYGMCAVALIAAQDTYAARRVYQPAPTIVAAQVDAVAADLGVHACKVGWLRSPEAVSVVAARIRRRHLRPVVVDPSLWSERGEAITPARTVKRLVRELLPLATVLTVTPRELGVLSGIPEPAERPAAMERLLALGAQSVVVEDAWGSGRAWIRTAGQTEAWAHWDPPEETPSGYGSLFSAALAAGLALEKPLHRAVCDAVAFLQSVRHEIRDLGRGLPVLRIKGAPGPDWRICVH
ncbi:MAG: bifunctional hydroxymethylpyrimidine kinase/phosphomethylpyrimidine kinase, partial [Armatimonadota bacterium]|nr:bifunctional hydroxymethylpyrimidine kinase/phosphomethylpyrimidine kinase [Armatimonadota bacterium]